MADTSDNAEQNRWLNLAIEHLAARDGVTRDILVDGQNVFEITVNGDCRTATLGDAGTDYPTLKRQIAELRETLTALGIVEGQIYVPPKPSSRRAPTPEMLAARAKQKKEFDAWQEIWRRLGLAEKALDVAFEITQMRDYY